MKENNKHSSCASHCCRRHGCKYNYKDCPVLTDRIIQDHLCEDCHQEPDKYGSVEELQRYGPAFIKLYPRIYFGGFMKKNKADRVLKSALASPMAKYIEFELEEVKNYRWIDESVELSYSLVGYIRGAKEEFEANPQGFYL